MSENKSKSIDFSLVSSLNELKNNPAYQGRTLLHELIELNLPNKIRNVRIRFDAKEDVIFELPYRLEDEDYNNLLIVACALNRTECIRELKEFGLTFKDALMCIYAVPHYMTRDIMDVFINHYGLTLNHLVDPGVKYGNVLYWLVVFEADKNFEGLFNYIFENMGLNEKNLLMTDKNGNTIFHHLLRFNYRPDSEVLERTKLFLNFAKRVGVTFLDLAVTKNKNGKTPFHFIKNTKLEEELMPIFYDYQRIRDDYSSDDELDYKYICEPYRVWL